MPPYEAGELERTSHLNRTLVLIRSRRTAMAKEIFPGITADPQVMHGRPVIEGTRVPIEVVLGELAGGSSFDEIADDYHLTIEQIRAALAYATHLLSSTTVYAAS